MTIPSHSIARFHARGRFARACRAPAPAAALASLLSLAAGSSPGALVLNEVLYDPAGEDAGAEFVELWNGGDAPAALDSVVIEAGDGARPGVWTTVFAGAAGESVAARSAFLVAGDRLTGLLQNGPDAVRLVRGGAVLDLLGWGALADAGFYEGLPAPDVSSGASLARRADGADTDRNDADWEPAASPTPGAANRPDFGIRTAGPSTLDPEVVWPGEACALSVPVLNHGRYALESSAWSVTVRTRAVPDAAADSGWSTTVASEGLVLAPGETAVWSTLVTPPVAFGAFEVSATVSLAASAEPGAVAVSADTAAAWGRVGPGRVAVSEVAFRDAGAGEWVEIVALGDVPSWSDVSLGDGSGAVRRLRPWRDAGADGVTFAGAGGARAGDLRVAVSDPTRFLGRYAVPESLLLVVEGGWLALNDAPSSGATWADGVRLLDAGGVPSDAMCYAASWTARGASLERISVRLPSAAPATWSESVSPQGGTPSLPNSIAAPHLDRPGGLPLLAVPSPVLRRAGAGDAAAMVIEVGPGAAGGSVRLAILDLRGRVRRVVADGVRFGGAGAVVWDGRDDAGSPLPAGIYVVRLEATLHPGDAPRRAAVSIAVAPGGSAR